MTVSVFVERCTGLDFSLFDLIFTPRRSRLGRWFFTLVSRSADGPWYLVLMLGLWVAAHPGAGMLLGAGVTAFALERPVYKFLKQRFRRARPCHRFSGVAALMPPPDEFSFPSGHTSGALVMAGLLAAGFPAGAPWFYAWAGCVAYARVYAGVHYPADTVAGAVIGHTCVQTALIAWGIN